MTAAAIATFVIVAAAIAIIIAYAAESFAACGAFYIVEINCIVEAYCFAAVRAFYLYAVIIAAVAGIIVVEAIVATAVAILFVAVLAFAIVAFVAVIFIFESAEILVYLLDVFFEIICFVVQIGNSSRKIGKKIENSCKNLIVFVCFESGNKTFDISNFFGKCHDKNSFFRIICNYFVFTLSRYSPVLVSMRSISPFSIKSGT